jgi:hypothetical protein
MIYFVAPLAVAFVMTGNAVFKGDDVEIIHSFFKALLAGALVSFCIWIVG